MVKKRVLHVFEWNFWGGVQSSTLSLIKEFNEFEHIVFQIYRKENGTLTNVFRFYGSELVVLNNFLSEKSVEKINPDIIFLHSVNKNYITNGGAWLEKYKTITIHHYVNNNYDGDLNWYVSEFIYNKTPNKSKKYIIQPPPIYTIPFLNIKRPNREPIIGRIQSSSLIKKGKFSKTFNDLIKKLKNKVFIVGPKSGNAPIIPDNMPEYLKNIDLFIIWGDTTETWSLVVSEANLSGIPVVVRRMNDGLTEQLEKSGGGILVDTEEEFLSSVNELINNKELRDEIAKRGKYWCLENTNSKLIKGYL